MYKRQLGVNEVENEVQADLDKVFNAGGVRFLLREVSGKTLELTFFRKYRKGHHTDRSLTGSFFGQWRQVVHGCRQLVS